MPPGRWTYGTSPRALTGRRARAVMGRKPAVVGWRGATLDPARNTAARIRSKRAPFHMYSRRAEDGGRAERPLPRPVVRRSEPAFVPRTQPVLAWVSTVRNAPERLFDLDYGRRTVVRLDACSRPSAAAAVALSLSPPGHDAGTTRTIRGPLLPAGALFRTRSAAAAEVPNGRCRSSDRSDGHMPRADEETNSSSGRGRQNERGRTRGEGRARRRGYRLQDGSPGRRLRIGGGPSGCLRAYPAAA